MQKLPSLINNLAQNQSHKQLNPSNYSSQMIRIYNAIVQIDLDEPIITDQESMKNIDLTQDYLFRYNRIINAFNIFGYGEYSTISIFFDPILYQIVKQQEYFNQQILQQIWENTQQIESNLYLVMQYANTIIREQRKIQQNIKSILKKLKNKQIRKQQHILCIKDFIENINNLKTITIPFFLSIQTKYLELYQQFRHDENYKTVKKELFLCGICCNQYKQKQVSQFFECDHLFCKQCISQHVFQKIKQMQIANCPEQSCKKLINLESKYYKTFPDSFKYRYYKIRQFQMTVDFNFVKMCPGQNCQGQIIFVQNQPMLCQYCHIQYCKKCLYPIHQNQCDLSNIRIIQQKFQFKQCSQCLIILQRVKGCNHMTCKCKYQFCYICGEKWEQKHMQCKKK